MRRHLAWSTLTELVPTELSLAVDDEPITVDAVDAERHHVALHERVGPRWERLTVSVHADLPDDLPERLRRPWTDVSTTAAVSCRPTNLRLGVALHQPPDGSPTSRTGSVELWHDELAGRLDVQAELTIATGSSAHRVLGSGRVWTVAVDEPTTGPGSSRSPFRVEWDDFTQPTRNPRLSGLGDVPSYLDLGGGEPVLYLNSAISNLGQLLSWDTARTSARDVRDLVAGTIAADAMRVIAAEAVDQVAELDTGPELPGLAVLDNALELLADQLPSVSSVDELLERVVHDREQGTGDALRSEVAAVVGRLCSLGETMGRAATRATDG